MAAEVQDGEGGQPGQDLVLAYAPVHRPVRPGPGGAGIAVAAPVGGLAVGPGRLQSPPAGPAGQQPGQQVPPRHWARRTAKRASQLGGVVIGRADDRPVRRAGGDHPPGRQVPPLYLAVPEPGVGRVDRVEVGALLVPHLPPGIPRVCQDRHRRAERPGRAGAVRIPLGVGGRRARIPASFKARVMRATLSSASRWANIHATTGAVSAAQLPALLAGLGGRRGPNPDLGDFPPGR